MRPSRRKLLGLGGAVALAGQAPCLALAQEREGDAVPVDAKPIPSLLAREPETTRFGALTYRSGLVLSSGAPGFGGFSALWRSPEGNRLVSLTDRGTWLTASVRYDGGRVAGLTDARLAPIRNGQGEPLRRAQGNDTESLAFAEDGTAYIGFERINEVWRFPWARDGVLARGAPIAVPPEVGQLPNNEGLEALAIPPRGHGLAGSVIAISERARAGEDAPTRGWVLTGPQQFAFDVARSKAFDITDLAFLPTGEALLLERRYKLLTGVACRIRRLAADAFRPGATIDGEVIFEADRHYEIDNMEGIAIHRDPGSGGLVVTLVSDDNFSPIQRTVLLEFALPA